MFSKTFTTPYGDYQISNDSFVIQGHTIDGITPSTYDPLKKVMSVSFDEDAKKAFADIVQSFNLCDVLKLNQFGERMGVYANVNAKAVCYNLDKDVIDNVSGVIKIIFKVSRFKSKTGVITAKVNVVALQQVKAEDILTCPF